MFCPEGESVEVIQIGGLVVVEDGPGRVEWFLEGLTY